MKRFMMILSLMLLSFPAYADIPINMGDNTFFVNVDTFDAQSISMPEDSTNFQGGYTVSMHVQDKILGFDVVATILSNPCYNHENSYIVFRVPNEEHWSYKWDYKIDGKRSVDQIARTMCHWTLKKLGE